MTDPNDYPILHVRIPRYLRDRIEAAAEAEGLKVSEWVRAVVRERLKRKSVSQKVARRQ